MVVCFSAVSILLSRMSAVSILLPRMSARAYGSKERKKEKKEIIDRVGVTSYVIRTR